MDPLTPITQQEVQQARIDNILEIALDFSGMLRVFEKKSNERILARLKEFCLGLEAIKDKAEFDRAHADFCDWFAKNICTAEKNFKNGRVQPSVACSYGHGAKVVDIAAKVYVYYCGQPSSDVAHKVVPMLHSALDTPMMLLLDTTRTTIKDVDQQHYEFLQDLVLRKAAVLGIYPVQYDDVMWRRLQRIDQMAGRIRT